MSYAGHVISADCLEITNTRTAAIKKLSDAANQTDLRSFSEWRKVFHCCSQREDPSEWAIAIRNTVGHQEERSGRSKIPAYKSTSPGRLKIWRPSNHR